MHTHSKGLSNGIIGFMIYFCMPMVILLILIISDKISEYLAKAKKYLNDRKLKTFTTILDLSKKQLEEMMCPFSISKDSVGAIRGLIPLADIYRQSYIINNHKIDAKTLETQINYFKGKFNSEEETIPYTQTDYTKIHTLFEKHQHLIMASQKINSEKSQRLFSGRIITAALLEHWFTTYSEVVPNISIIHDIVTNINASSISRSQLWLLQETFIKKIYNTHLPSCEFKDITISFTNISNHKVTCHITSNTTLEEYGNLEFSTVFTISSKINKPLTGVTYEDITIELNLPKTMKRYTHKATPINGNNTQDQAALIDKKTDQNGRVSLKYSLPNTVIPSFIDMHNTKAILDTIDECKTEQSAPNIKITDIDDRNPTLGTTDECQIERLAPNIETQCIQQT